MLELIYANKTTINQNQAMNNFIKLLATTPQHLNTICQTHCRPHTRKCLAAPSVVLRHRESFVYVHPGAHKHDLMRAA